MSQMLVANITPRRPGVNPRPACVEFLVDKVTLTQGFLRSTIVLTVRVIHQGSTLIHLSVRDTIYCRQLAA
jgi:hypothetical protein